MDGFGRVPQFDWRTWGQEKILTFKAGGNLRSDYQQIINISHPHPESWRFFVYAEPIHFPAYAELQIAFGLISGLGLTISSVQPVASLSFEDTSFVFLRWAAAAAKKPKWTAKGYAPVLDELTPKLPRQEVEVIPAQSIQIGVIAQSGAALLEDAQVRVVCGVAPNVFGDNGRAFQTVKNNWNPEITPEETGFYPGDEY